MCAGAYLSIVGPGNTLASSPAFTNMEDIASAEFEDWVTECQSYATAMTKCVSTGLAAVMGKFSAGVEQLKRQFDMVPNTDPIG